MDHPEKKIAYPQTDMGFEGTESGVPALLWFLLLAWVARVTVFVRQRSVLEFFSIDTSAWVQIAIVLFMFLFLLGSRRLMPMWSNLARTSVRMLFLYYILCTISAIWSPMPQYTLYRGFEFIISLMAVFVALSYSRNFAEAERKVLFVCFVTLVLSMYVTIKFHGLSFSLFDWHTNSYSAAAAIMFCYCVGEYFTADKKRAKMLKRYGILSLGALIIGTSAASNIAALCGIIFLFFLYRKFGLMTIAIFVLLAMFLVESDFSFFKAMLFPGKDTHDIVTIRGRILLWDYLIEIIKMSPIYGHGFAVLSTGRDRLIATYSHNSLISVLLGTGAIGAIAFMLYGFRLLREIIQTTREKYPGAIGCASALIAGLVNSLSMPLVGDQYEESSLVFACMTALFVLFVFLPYREKMAKNSRVGGME